MKILTFIVSCYLAQVLAAQDMNEIAISASDENELILSKLVAALSEIKSSQCKSDLNLTVNAFRDGRPWAIASKNESECIYEQLELTNYTEEFFENVFASQSIKLSSNAT